MNKNKLGLGLAALGRPEYINIRSDSDIDKTEESFRNNAIDVLDFAYQQGIRYFDTAPSYGKGEQFLIDWNTKHGFKDVQLSTKWGYTYRANWQLGFQGSHEVKEHSLIKLLEQWQTSKSLLPALKIYQVHSATFDSGILENKDVHEKLYQIIKETGLQIGLTTSGSNQSEILKAALKIKIKNEFLFSSFQVTYNILERSTDPILRQILREGKTVIIKEALANGRLFRNKKFNHYKSLYDYSEQLANKYKVGVDAIFLRVCMQTLPDAMVLSGASNIEHLQSNLKANDFQLTEKEIQLLSRFTVDSENYWKERKALSWN